MVKLRCRSKILFSVSSGIVSTEGETFSRQKNAAHPKSSDSSSADGKQTVHVGRRNLTRSTILGGLSISGKSPSMIA